MFLTFPNRLVYMKVVARGLFRREGDSAKERRFLQYNSGRNSKTQTLLYERSTERESPLLISAVPG